MKKVFSFFILFFICVYCPLALSGQDEDLAVFNQTYERYVESFAKGHFRKSLPEARSAYELGQQLFGDEDESIANLAYNYGNNLLRVRKYKEAKPVLNKALESFERLYGVESVELVPVLMSLSHVYANTNKRRTQKKLYKRAFNLAGQHYGEGSAEFGMFSVRSGAAILDQAHDRSGVRYIQSGYDILKKANLGDDHLDTGVAAYRLGLYELSEGRYKAAKLYLLEALTIFEQPGKPTNKFELSVHTFLIQTFEELGESDRATKHCLAIGRMTPFKSEQEYFPLYKQAPVYPYSALRQGSVGYVVVEYSVDESGFVQDPRMVDIKGHPDFEQVALTAARRFRYAPRFVDGEPVLVKDVQNKFTFEIVR